MRTILVANDATWYNFERSLHQVHPSNPGGGLFCFALDSVLALLRHSSALRYVSIRSARKHLRNDLTINEHP